MRRGQLEEAADGDLNSRPLQHPVQRQSPQPYPVAPQVLESAEGTAVGQTRLIITQNPEKGFPVPVVFKNRLPGVAAGGGRSHDKGRRGIRFEVGGP